MDTRHGRILVSNRCLPTGQCSGCLMPAKHYEVNLSADERKELQRLVSTGTVAAYTRTRAHIFLKADHKALMARRGRTNTSLRPLMWGVSRLNAPVTSWCSKGCRWPCNAKSESTHRCPGNSMARARLNFLLWRVRSPRRACAVDLATLRGHAPRA